MKEASEHDSWSVGQSYDHYMGRWSRLIAKEFLNWQNIPKYARWADIGCGTGALTRTILDHADPASVVGVDPSEGFIAHARKEIADERATFEIGDAQDIPVPDNTVDVAASALVLNFVPDKPRAIGEMQRITRPGGTVSFYVWDYPGGGMGFIDTFWKAAATLDPAARKLDEADRFPFCTPEGLERLCREANIQGVTVKALEVDTVFPDFEAFWHPFTLGAGPAPGYCMSLSTSNRERLRKRLEELLGGENEIRLTARAWAVSMTNI
ncbi:class I SAM-dependent methyltransferase [Rhizobiales bacterium]|uniref:class I SAM-dependent methyltransferase n=1 Tax=Hongsoonwoonella zoysiae TaxID=2821844 RepID=UPI0015603B43|nr:class I SAM-dependent methyltransferase [Hongsoonwoonella zoysiae]NRG18353.1 class I SAM-dependent methyltransferase [Hongsoonwoonella zoysiae]